MALFSICCLTFWNLKPAFRFKWKHKMAHGETEPTLQGEPLCWLFTAEWQLMCVLKIKQKNLSRTIMVFRAYLTAHEPEKPKIKKTKGESPRCLWPTFPLVWDSTFRAVTLSSPCWEGGCGWGWQGSRAVHLFKGIYWESSVMWQDKGQSTGVAYPWKGFFCKRTRKAVVSKCLPGCPNTSENHLRLYSKAVFRHIIVCGVCCILSTWKKKCRCCGTCYRLYVLRRISQGFGLQ